MADSHRNLEHVSHAFHANLITLFHLLACRAKYPKGTTARRAQRFDIIPKRPQPSSSLPRNTRRRPNIVFPIPYANLHLYSDLPCLLPNSLRHCLDLSSCWSFCCCCYCLFFYVLFIVLTLKRGRTDFGRNAPALCFIIRAAFATLVA